MKIFILSRILLILCSIEASSAFCEDNYFHPTEIAGSLCTKENEGIICDSNTDPLCTEDNCNIQMGGFEEYTCGLAQFHYEEFQYGDEELMDIWKEKCCDTQAPQMAGCLGDETLQISGDCTYDKVLEATRPKGCTKEDIYSYLKVGNESDAIVAVNNLCNDAYSNYVDSFFQFSDIAKSGYQFDREFMNGGSDWINTFNPDMSRIQWVQDNVLSTQGISFPEYLYNFNTEKSCDSNAVMCCWIADSTDAGEGTCSDSAGCQDGDPLDNTDICLVDIENSPLASHTASGIAIYDDDSEGAANCMGFTWSDNSLGDLYKGNLLFEIAMRYGLKDNGYTRSVPHAPMCACAEQMPYVSHADCTDLSSDSTWSIFPDSESGLLTIKHDNANINFNNCNGQGLAAHYESVHNKSISHRIDDCSNFDSSVISKRGFKKENRVKWIKVAGKGQYAETDNPEFTEQLHDGYDYLTSMSREDFEGLWAKSSLQLLLRECKFCSPLHKFVYYKRYDQNGLPPNVDLLYDVKEHWTSYENSTWGSDWNLFSTVSDALADKEPWERVNYDYKDHYGNWVGFPRDASPYDGHIHNQWNIWDKPIWNVHYGQMHVAFYVGISPDTDATVPTAAPVAPTSQTCLDPVLWDYSPWKDIPSGDITNPTLFDVFVANEVFVATTTMAEVMYRGKNYTVPDGTPDLNTFGYGGAWTDRITSYHSSSLDFWGIGEEFKIVAVHGEYLSDVDTAADMIVHLKGVPRNVALQIVQQLTGAIQQVSAAYGTNMFQSESFSRFCTSVSEFGWDNPNCPGCMQPPPNSNDAVQVPGRPRGMAVGDGWLSWLSSQSKDKFTESCVVEVNHQWLFILWAIKEKGICVEGNTYHNLAIALMGYYFARTDGGVSCTNESDLQITLDRISNVFFSSCNRATNPSFNNQQFMNTCEHSFYVEWGYNFGKANSATIEEILEALPVYDVEANACENCTPDDYLLTLSCNSSIPIEIDNSEACKA